MEQVRRLQQASIMAVSLLGAGCAGGVIPGSDGADPSCVLLCALQREVAGAPVSPTPPVPPMKSAIKLPSATAHVAAAKSVPKPLATRVARRPSPPANVSVVRQAPPREQAPAPAAMVPPAPVAVVPLPALTPPARSLTQAIPGSAGIVAPGWQSQ